VFSVDGNSCGCAIRPLVVSARSLSQKSELRDREAHGSPKVHDLTLARANRIPESEHSRLSPMGS
jgi:hypothetical protein